MNLFLMRESVICEISHLIISSKTPEKLYSVTIQWMQGLTRFFTALWMIGIARCWWPQIMAKCSHDEPEDKVVPFNSHFRACAFCLIKFAFQWAEPYFHFYRIFLCQKYSSFQGDTWDLIKYNLHILRVFIQRILVYYNTKLQTKYFGWFYL